MRLILNLLFCRDAAILGMLGVPKREDIPGVVRIAVPVVHSEASMWLRSVPDMPDPIRIFAHCAISFFLVVVIRGVEFAFFVEREPVRITNAPGEQLGSLPSGRARYTPVLHQNSPLICSPFCAGTPYGLNAPVDTLSEYGMTGSWLQILFPVSVMSCPGMS